MPKRRSHLKIISIIFFCLLSIECKSQQTKSAKRMIPNFYDSDISTPIEIKINPVEIRSAPGEILTAAAPPETGSQGYLFRYLNSRKNCRLQNNIPDADFWRIKWSAKLDSSVFPWYILTDKDRIIVQNESGWQLFDTTGKSILSGGRSEGDISIDDTRNIFFVNETSGLISAFGLKDGTKEFSLYPYFGLGYIRNVYPSAKNGILITGIELPVMSHKRPVKPADFTIWEKLELGDTKSVDADGILSNAGQVNKLLCRSKPRVIAVNNKDIVFATRDNIYIIDDKLKITAWFTGNFNPMEISLDEASDIYLTVKVENPEGGSQNYLWVIDREGRRIAEAPLPEFDPGNASPPAVGFNHFIYLSIKNRIMVFDEAGRILWDNYTKGEYNYISVLPDSKLLVSEGSLLTLMDIHGVRKMIYDFGDQNLLTRPVLSINGDIFVASKDNLYCLEPKK